MLAQSIAQRLVDPLVARHAARAFKLGRDDGGEEVPAVTFHIDVVANEPLRDETLDFGGGGLGHGGAILAASSARRGYDGFLATRASFAVRSIFHLAFNVRDLAEARRFYGDTLGCTEGRSAPSWVDYDFFGHQISLHLGEPFATTRTGVVGEHLVPMPHYGVILEFADWQALASRLKGRGVQFVIEPTLRFEGLPGEQWTMFFVDPFGNPMEIKGFRSLSTVYAA